MEKKELFERAFNLETEVLEAQELLKELKAEATYSEDNPKGLHKDDVAAVMKAAKLYSKSTDIRSKILEMEDTESLIEELA